MEINFSDVVFCGLSLMVLNIMVLHYFVQKDRERTFKLFENMLNQDLKKINGKISSMQQDVLDLIHKNG